jgi:O-antigen/teichoic acid export membrane protein
MPKPLNVPLQTILIVFSFLGCARIIDLMTGVNSIIISYSQEYKYHMYFLMLLGISNLVLNYFLLKQFGLPGVAFSTLLSYLLFNGVKYYFVKRKFGLSIHFKNHIVSVLAALVVFSCMMVLPFGDMPVINIILKPALVTVLFGVLIWWLNPGGEIRSLLRAQFCQFMKR